MLGLPCCGLGPNLTQRAAPPPQCGGHFFFSRGTRCFNSATSRSVTLPAMAFVVELLVLELVHHFYIARNLFPDGTPPDAQANAQETA